LRLCASSFSPSSHIHLRPSVLTAWFHTSPASTSHHKPASSSVRIQPNVESRLKSQELQAPAASSSSRFKLQPSRKLAQSAAIPLLSPSQTSNKATDTARRRGRTDRDGWREWRLGVDARCGADSERAT
ncbi:hypothetical protein C8F01DRAFT_1226611, partial [Mycena amicta]